MAIPILGRMTGFLKRLGWVLSIKTRIDAFQKEVDDVIRKVRAIREAIAKFIDKYDDLDDDAKEILDLVKDLPREVEEAFDKARKVIVP